jgi:hypothetical protein
MSEAGAANTSLTSPLPLQELSQEVLSRASVLASDIDGTLTDKHGLSVLALTRIRELAENGVAVILVSGRSAGWVGALTHYLPGVSAGVAENGGVLIDAEGGPILLDGWDEDEINERMVPVRQCLREISRRYDGLTVSNDGFTRLTDLAFKVNAPAQALAAIASEFAVTFTYSAHMQHLSASALDKGHALEIALTSHLPLTDVVAADNVITIGDSMNDSSLFVRDRFAASVGVAAILNCLTELGEHAPEYVTTADGAAGFNELADLILQR